MAVEIFGNPKDVKRYREYLHQRGIQTKRFMDSMRSQGYQLSEKPEGFRVFRSGIQKVYNDPSKKELSKFKPEEKLYIAGIANANMVDRMDERLEPSGIDIENFMSNAVLLIDHLYTTSAVIGRVVEIRPEDNGTHFEAYIGDPSKAPLTQKQIDTRSLVAQKLLQTVSVGFIPLAIRAPEYDEDGKLMNPAVILNWELLELSVVAVPANPGAVFDLKENEQTERKVFALPQTAKSEVKQEEQSTTVQSVICSKDVFSKDEAIEWVKSHDFRYDKLDETEDSYRFRQRDPSEFVEGSFKTIDITEGVKAVIGHLKTEVGDARAMEEKLGEMIELMKRMNSLMVANGEKLAGIGDKLETVMSKLEAGSEPMDEEEDMPEHSQEDEEEKGKPKPKEDDDKEEMKALRNYVEELEKKFEKLSFLMLKCLESNTIAGG